MAWNQVKDKSEFQKLVSYVTSSVKVTFLVMQCFFQ